MSAPVGDVASPEPEMPGFPLAGRRILLTRSTGHEESGAARVRALGGEPVLAPAIAIAPPESWSLADALLQHIDDYDCVAFTSANAVRALVDRADAIGVAREGIGRRRLAVVGPATASAVAAALRDPDLVAHGQGAEALAEELPVVEGACVLFPRGDLAGDALPRGLRRRGAIVDDVVVYRTVPGDGVAAIAERMRAGTADAVLFASASAVRFVAGALGEASGGSASGERAVRAAVFCIGPSTADAARAAGFDPVAIPGSATQDELIDRVAAWFAARRQGERR